MWVTIFCRVCLMVNGWLLFSFSHAQGLQFYINSRLVSPEHWRSARIDYLTPQEKTLQITLLNSRPRKRYEWQMSGRDSVWRSFSERADLAFDNLAGETITFLVREPGKPPLIRRTIVVEKALWQNWWLAPLLFTYGLLVMGILMYLFYRYRIRQILRLQQIRDSIARDLHDDMGSYLGSISLLSQTARQLARTDPARTQSVLEKIGDLSRLVMESMGDIVWSVNPGKDSMTELVARMRDVAADLFQNQPVELIFEESPTVAKVNLPLQHRRDFYLIYKEAITNAAKYAGARQLKVRLEGGSGLLSLTIQDDGIGFNPADPERKNASGGNGLHNMKNRAAKIRGHLLIDSRPEKGTVVRLEVPV
ncbi:sensor histidine kinase [Larkinella soli]|uniref:sensor histidine kinase n=1 Tax=Larkinella soli TaxID=1770527 RepID=UPI000FFC68AD|nr:ATP-binding protein [Larkinella soli]